MSIAETVSFDKEGRVEHLPWLKKFYLTLVILLVASLSFGIGRLSAGNRGRQMKIEYDPSMTDSPVVSGATTQQTASVLNSITETSTSVVASSKGTKYHYPNCPGAKQIKEENRVIFASSAVAEAAGYTLAANCSPR